MSARAAANTSWLPPAPLCNAGRCAQILGALAEARSVERLVQTHSEFIQELLTRALTKVGVDVDDPEVLLKVADALDEVVAERADKQPTGGQQ